MKDNERMYVLGTCLAINYADQLNARQAKH